MKQIPALPIGECLELDGTAYVVIECLQSLSDPLIQRLGNCYNVYLLRCLEDPRSTRVLKLSNLYGPEPEELATAGRMYERLLAAQIARGQIKHIPASQIEEIFDAKKVTADGRYSYLQQVTSFVNGEALPIFVERCHPGLRTFKLETDTPEDVIESVAERIKMVKAIAGSNIQLTGQLYQAGVVHGDLKPGNMLVHVDDYKDGSLQLHVTYADVETMVIADDRLKYDYSQGTILFAPPEQREGFNNASKIDIYAGGMIVVKQCSPRALNTMVAPYMKYSDKTCPMFELSLDLCDPETHAKALAPLFEHLPINVFPEMHGVQQYLEAVFRESPDRETNPEVLLQRLFDEPNISVHYPRP